MQLHRGEVKKREEEEKKKKKEEKKGKRSRPKGDYRGRFARTSR